MYCSGHAFNNMFVSEKLNQQHYITILKLLKISPVIDSTKMFVNVYENINQYNSITFIIYNMLESSLESSYKYDQLKNLTSIILLC